MEKVITQPEPKQRQVKVEKPAEKGRGMLGDLLWGTKRRQGMVENTWKIALNKEGR